MNDLILSASHVCKRFATHTALNDVSIDVQRGHIFGLLGHNGAGKTTLIRIINHITAPDSGTVTFDGLRSRKTMWHTSATSPKNADSTRK